MRASGKTVRGRGRPPREIDERALQEAAVRVFATEGYFAATVDQIAQRAGTSKALLFRRYESKGALFDWAVEHEVRHLTEKLFRAYERADERSVTEALRAGVDAIIGHAVERPHGFRLLFQAGFSAGQGATAPWEKVRGLVTDRIQEVVRQRLDASGSPGGPMATGILASALVGASEHVARRLGEDRRLDPEAASDLLTQFLAVGVKGLTPEVLAAAGRTRGEKR